jgi:hypothetical protein
MEALAPTRASTLKETDMVVALAYNRNNFEPLEENIFTGAIPLVDTSFVERIKKRMGVTKTGIQIAAVQHGIIQYGSSYGYNQWEEAIKTYNPLYAVSYLIGTEAVMEYFLSTLDELLLHVQRAIMVSITNPDLIDMVPKRSDVYSYVYAHTRVGSVREFKNLPRQTWINPFLYHGRKIWLSEASHLNQWGCYAEYMALGADVVGITLSMNFAIMAKRKQVIGQTLYDTEAYPDMSFADCKRASIMKLVNFWSGR